MRIPAILQGEARTRFLQGIAFGAVAAMAIGFIWGGWVTGGTARTMSAMAENSGRMSILVPMCVAQFTAADGAVAKFKAASSYSRDNVISEFVKTVASTSMDYSLARACAAGVEAELARTATKELSGRFAKTRIQRNERSQVRTVCLSWILLVGSHPVRLLCAPQSLSGRQLRNHGPESDTQSLTSRVPFFFENPTGSRPWLHCTVGQWIRLRPLLLLF